MTTDTDAQYVSSTPEVIPARVSIEHLQLRDLLQVSNIEGKCLFVNRHKIEEVDFSNPRAGAVHFETLDFKPNCLITGQGLVAAGGQQSELFVCPIGKERNRTSSSPTARKRWTIHTTTGGSINNSIAIHSEIQGSNRSPPLPATTLCQGLPQASAPFVHHRRRQQGPAKLDEGEAAELEIEAEGWAAARGFSYRESSLKPPPRSPNRHKEASASRYAGNTRKTFDGRSDEESEVALNHASKKGKSNIGSHLRKDSPSFVPAVKNEDPNIRLYVSNNDRSLKIYDLPHHPSSQDSDVGASTGSDQAHRRKVSRSETLDFPTAINHSSLSPDGSTLVVVGDTPQVFLYHRDQDTGAFLHLTTYHASSEASFSTAWHPDGTSFAVASQDGSVSVWNVRSSKKLAELRSSQSVDMPPGFGMIGSLNGAAGAVRAVKFSPCGRFLAFTEHRKYFHIYETETYKLAQRIALPSTSWHRTSGPRGSNTTAPYSQPGSADATSALFPESRERSGRVSHWGSLDRASIAAEDSTHRVADHRGSMSSQTDRRSVADARREAPTSAEPDANTGNSTPGYRTYDYRSTWRDRMDLTQSSPRPMESDPNNGNTRELRSLSPGDVQTATSSGSANSSNSLSSDETADYGNSALERMRQHFRNLEADVEDVSTPFMPTSTESGLEGEAERALSAYIPAGLRESWLRGGEIRASEDPHLPVLRAYSALSTRGPRFGAFGPGSTSHGVSLGTGSNATQLRLGRAAAAAAAAATSNTTSSRDAIPLSALHPDIYSQINHPPHIGDPVVNIAGLCWDANSKFIYVATERLICRFEVLQRPWSYPRGDVR
ncbi:unnamed protein product [Sympodiomycopsis kandeliae]